MFEKKNFTDGGLNRETGDRDQNKIFVMITLNLDIFGTIKDSERR